MMKNRQSGFSLIELMVAMVIGLLITLGAGQLFLIGLQNFRQVELLGNKQAALTFAAEMIIRDIRRADKNIEDIKWDNSAKTLTLSFTAMADYRSCSGQEVTRTYYVDGYVGPSEGWSLMLDDQGCNPEPLVTGFGPEGFDVDDTEGGSGVYVVTFCLISEPGDTDCNLEAEGVEFHAVNRTAAVTG